MKKILFIISLLLLTGCAKEQNLGLFSDPFISIQLADSPAANNVLTTDGTDNLWSSEIIVDGVSTSMVTTTNLMVTSNATTTGSHYIGGDLAVNTFASLPYTTTIGDTSYFQFDDLLGLSIPIIRAVGSALTYPAIEDGLVVAGVNQDDPVLTLMSIDLQNASIAWSKAKKWLYTNDDFEVNGSVSTTANMLPKGYVMVGNFNNDDSISNGDINLTGSLTIASTTVAGKGTININNQRLIHTYGTDNLFIGLKSGTLLQVTQGNLGIGNGVMPNPTANSVYFNTGIGHEALNFLSTGDFNTGIGFQSLYKNTTGSYNTCFGMYCLRENASGDGNFGGGYAALYNTTGFSNMGLGYFSLYNNTTGNQNMALGAYAGTGINYLKKNLTGNNNVYIGYNSGTSNTNLQNCIAIGASSTCAISNSMVVGGYEADNLAVNLGVATNTPGYRLVVNADNATTDPFQVATTSNQGLFVVNKSGFVGVNTTTNFWLNSRFAVNGNSLFAGSMTLASTTSELAPISGTFEYFNDRMYLTNVATRRAIDRTNGVLLAVATTSDTTDETTLYTSPIAANDLKEGNIIKVNTMGIMSAESAADVVTGRLYFGSQLIATVNSAGSGVLTDDPWHFLVICTIQSVGVNGKVACHEDLDIDGSSHFAQVRDIDTTQAEDFTVTIQWNNAKAGNIVAIHQGFTEFKN